MQQYELLCCRGAGKWHVINLVHQLSLLRTSNALNLKDFFEHVELTV